MINRTKERIKQTGEVSTPHELCLQMVKDIPEMKLRDLTTTYLDPSCGDGNFLVALFQVLTEEYNHDPQHVLDYQLYGVDLMPDNIEVARNRLGITPEMKAWNHVICADALKYDYSFE